MAPITTASANHQPGDARLNCEPENDTNPTGTNHTVTCTLRDAAGATVLAQNAAITVNGEVDCLTNCDGVATYDGQLDGDANDAPLDGDQAPDANDDDRTDPDGTCVIPQQQSACTFTYDRNNEGNDELNFWIAGHATDAEAANEPENNDTTDTVLKNWEDRVATNIDCEPENEVNQTNDPHTVTCTTTDQFGQPVNSTNTAGNDDTAFDQTGGSPNNVQEDNTTNNNGQATIVFTDDQPGTVTTTGCIDQNNNGTCDAGEPQDQTTKTFQAGQASGLDAQPETDTNTVGQQHTVTCQVFNQFGNQNNTEGTNNQTCNFEFFQGSPSDQDGNTPTTPDRACTTNAQGTCQITYTSNTAGTDLICVYLGTDENLQGTNQGGTCDGEGLTDQTGENTTPNPNTDDQDVVQKVWQAGAGGATQINAEPENDTNPVGTQHIIRVSARDANNQGTTATPIRADILPGSANASQQTGQAEINCTQDAVNEAGNAQTFTGPAAGQTQTHECAYTGANAGTDNVRVFADTNNNNIFDQGEPFDDVVKIWSGQAFALTITPEQDTATAGTCNEFTITVVDQAGNPVVGQVVDVEQVLQSAGTEPNETRELAFCNPQNAQGPNPTGQGGTAFGDVSGNNQGQTAGLAGRNTTVRAEVGPTNTQGQVTFGITINQTTQNATVNVRGWVDQGPGGDNDQFDAGEPTDTAVKTWTPGGTGAVTGIDAAPESATNPNGTQHQVTVTLTGAGGPIQGVTPNSIIATNAAGRPQGDVADANAGTSPNAAANQGNFNVYNCTATNAQGVSTCTFQDSTNTPAGTDTIVFYVNQAGGGTAGPDANEPQDAVQKTWTAGPQNLNIDVTCAGTGTADDGDAGEQGIDNPGTPDCTNPLSDQDEVFTATVLSNGGVGQANIRVDFSFGQRTNGNNPGANNSTNDATLNATPGGQVGTTPGGLQTFCLTNANGTCSVTLTNPTPQAGDTIEVIGTISGQTVPGTQGGSTDGATKQWQAGAVNQVGTVTLTPRAATNQVGTPHTVTATVRNQFGQPVQGANVDFRITSGPNAGLAQAGMTDAVTDANGNATFTYTSNAVGTDTIVACTETGGSENDTCNPGEPSGQATKTWQTGPVTTGAVNLDMQARTQDVNGADTAVDDCEVTTPANANREKTATNQINPNVATGAQGATNFHEICASAFQTNASAPTAGQQITFTISGVGRIFAVGANERCSTATTPPAGTTITVTADANGIARACLFSQQVGRTTVTASSGNPAQTDTGTKDWTVNPNTARFIQLCHGDVAGTTCETANQTNEPGDEHQLTARVTDRQGNPVANVPVQFRETGPAIFTPQGGSTATVLTDANGLASVLMTSDVEGTSTVVAEISPVGTGGGFRGAGANDDECEQPAGTNNQPAAGNCISQTLTKVWDEDEVVPPQCDNGIDDDDDGLTDFGEDPGCVDDNDNSELPRNVDVDPTKVPHERRISIRFTDGTGKNNNGLVIFGRLRVPDGFNDCRTQQPINVQRRINGRWITKKTTNTNRRGRYAVEIFDQASRYRAVAVRTEILDESLNELHVCKKAVKAKRHRHRR